MKGGGPAAVRGANDAKFEHMVEFGFCNLQAVSNVKLRETVKLTAL